VRTKPSYDEFLEPLPVVVDGVTMAPVWAHPRLTEVAPDTFEAVDAVCARILETPGFAGLAPWLGPRSPVPESRALTPPTTFSRIFELHPVQLELLPGWWEQHARNERVTIARRLSLGRPQRIADGVWTVRASLCGPWQVRPMPVELSLWRHLGGWTKLTLEPQRRVYIKSIYFDTGHRALDVLCGKLTRELARQQMAHIP
jgi:hypothetical protein